MEPDLRATKEANPHRSAGLLWMLLAVALSIPWLLPTHAQPWTSFHADAAMALAMLPILAGVLLMRQQPIHIPLEAIAVVALSTIPLVQLAIGVIVYPGDALLASGYLLLFAVCIVVGSRLQQQYLWALPSVLFAAFTLASVISVTLMLAQWTGIDGIGTLLMALPEGSRLSGNLGQPNHMATLLVWGLLGLGWFRFRGYLSGYLTWVLSALALGGIAMTQSRAGLVELMVIAVAAWCHRRRVAAHASGFAFAALVVWFACAWLGWAWSNGSASSNLSTVLGDRLEPGTRLQHWKLLLDATLLRPLCGWGWNQIVHAQFQLAPMYEPTREVVHYSHNLFLDLILWNGWPIGVIGSLAVLAWCAFQIRRADSVERVLVLMVVLVFVVHAMVELPHAYLIFLMPVGLMVGVLHVPVDRCAGVSIRRSGTLMFLVTLVLAGIVTIREYLAIEEFWTAQRFRTAGFVAQREHQVPDALVLSNLRALLLSMQMIPADGMSPSDLRLLGQAAQRFPSAGALFRYAMAQALNGESASARNTLVVLCVVHSQRICDSAAAAWKAHAIMGRDTYLELWPAEFGPNR